VASEIVSTYHDMAMHGRAAVTGITEDVTLREVRVWGVEWAFSGPILPDGGLLPAN